MFSLTQIIYFDHCAVNITAQRFPVIIDCQNFRMNSIRCRELFVWNHFEFQLFQIFQRLTVLGKRDAVSHLDIKHIDIQPSPRGNLWVQLTQRAGSCVSGVGKQWFPLLLLTGIQLFKAFFGHKNLAADNQPWRGIFETHGNRTDGFQVFRNILADIAVTAGGAPNKLSVHVFQCNR